MIGEVIGSYRLVAELGKGGMGVVYRAEHVSLGRQAALKMLLPQLSADPAMVQRFFNEARAASAIDHPGIVEIYDFGRTPDGRAYLVMPLLKGESLDERLAGGALAPLDGATLVAQVAAALAAAHARGIVHRDLKPDNIFLVPNELMPGGVQVKLLDFGIAKLGDDQFAGVKTQTGLMIGTPAYMSPEQCMGRADIDHRTDLYSLGCILFHVLCGRPPFTSDQGTGMMIAAHMRDPAPHPRAVNPAVPEALAAITLRLLEKDPAARFQSATAVRDALAGAGATAPTRPPQPSPAAGTLGHAPTLMSSPPTTHGSAASQLVVPPEAPRGSRRGLWIGLAALALIGGGVAVIAATRGEPPAPPVPAPTTRAPIAAAPAPAPTPPAVPVTAPPDAGALAMRPTPPTPATPPTTPPAPHRSAAPVFKLDAAKYRPGAEIRVRFAAPVASPPQSRTWVTVVEADKPASDYGAWVFVDDGAVAAALPAPSKPGAYEVRLHTDYPSRQYNVQRTVAITIADDAPVQLATGSERFTLASRRVRAGDSIEVEFPHPLHALPNERYWITVVARGTPDAKWGAYAYVDNDAPSLVLTAPTQPGAYEVRLHGNYPTKATNVVYRLPLQVE